MIIQKKNIGWDGHYTWLIDGKETRLSEPEIIKLVGKANEKTFSGLWNYYGSFSFDTIKGNEV